MNAGVGMVDRCFASSKCEILLRRWIGSKPNLVLARKKMDEVDRFSSLGNCISPGGSM